MAHVDVSGLGTDFPRFLESVDPKSTTQFFTTMARKFKQNGKTRKRKNKYFPVYILRDEAANLSLGENVISDKWNELFRNYHSDGTCGV